MVPQQRMASQRMRKFLQPLRICLFGVARSGKDTAADYLKRRYGFQLHSFASPLKESLRSMFGFTHDQLYGDAKDHIDPRYGITPRKAMTWIGSDIFKDETIVHSSSNGSDARSAHHTSGLSQSMRCNFWIHRLFANPSVGLAANVCIVDGRRQEEFQAAVAHRFVPVLIYRSKSLNSSQIPVHVSEHFVTEQSHAVRHNAASVFCHTLDNNHSVRQLYSSVDDLVEKLSQSV